MAGCRRHRCRSAFKCGDALFQNGGRRIGDARIDIAECLKAEQGGRVVGILEHKRRRLIDRCCARARRRIGPRPCVNSKRFNSGRAF